MLELKACVRCRGDMHLTGDLYGEYKQCLQCGHVVDLPRTDGMFSIPELKDKKKVA